MSYLFPPSRPLLYPQFETYRLHSLSPDNDVSSYPLPGKATQSREGYHANFLSFKEVRSRIGWDHLTVGSGRRGVYVDVDWVVWGFYIEDDYSPTFARLAELPAPVGSSDLNFQPEYPSVLELSPTQWAIATGSGSVYILHSTSPGESFTGQLVARYDLASASSSNQAPFLLRASHLASTDEVKLLLSHTLPVAPDTKPRTQAKTFELLEVSLDPGRNNAVDENPEELSLNWRLHGQDLPYWCCWYRDGWCVLGGETFTQPKDGVEELDEPSAATAPSKPGLGAMLPPPLTTKKKTTDADAALPPYTWTQNAESLTLSIPFPAGTTRADLSMSLSSSHLALAYAPVDPPTSQLSDQLAGFLARSERHLWASIAADESTWTFDATTSILELELEKADENTRWPSIFIPDEDDEYAEVPETFSAAMLAAVKETFNNSKTREPGEPEGNHPAIPALLREEMDFDLDDEEDDGGHEGMFGEGGTGKVGRDVIVGFIRDGVPSFSKQAVSVLSTPLSIGDGTAGIIIKSAVDGLLFKPPPEGDCDSEPWVHEATVPALAFVMSSKKDLRLVRHLTPSHHTAPPHSPKRAKTEQATGTTVLAFDAGSSSAGQGNVYVYYPPSNKTTAKQGVVRVAGGERGALLGVGAVDVGGKQVVLALCETELVVLHGVV